MKKRFGMLLGGMALALTMGVQSCLAADLNLTTEELFNKSLSSSVTEEAINGYSDLAQAELSNKTVEVSGPILKLNPEGSGVALTLGKQVYSCDDFRNEKTTKVHKELVVMVPFDVYRGTFNTGDYVQLDVQHIFPRANYATYKDGEGLGYPIRDINAATWGMCSSVKEHRPTDGVWEPTTAEFIKTIFENGTYEAGRDNLIPKPIVPFVGNRVKLTGKVTYLFTDAEGNQEFVIAEADEYKNVQCFYNVRVKLASPPVEEETVVTVNGVLDVPILQQTILEDGTLRNDYSVYLKDTYLLE